MALKGLVKTAKIFQSSKPQLGFCAVSMEVLLCLLLNLFVICVLNKIPCAKALSTLWLCCIGLTLVHSDSGTVMPSPWMTEDLQVTLLESLIASLTH